MMSMYARVAADSKFCGHRLTSLELLYPTAIHAQVMGAMAGADVTVAPRTSSELVIEVADNDFSPEVTGRRTIFGEKAFQHEWQAARQAALSTARRLIRPPEPVNDDVVANLLAPFSHTRALVTAENWDALQAPTPSWELEKLGECVRVTLTKSSPVEREPGDWHLPYLGSGDIDRAVLDILSTSPPGGYSEPAMVERTIAACRQISAARVAYVTDAIEMAACLVQEAASQAYRHQSYAGADGRVFGWLRGTINP